MRRGRSRERARWDIARSRVGGALDARDGRTNLTATSRIEQVAVRAAKEGGAVMSKKVGAAVIKTKVNARDLLTEVDGEVQRIIEQRVADAFPNHGFLVRTTVLASVRDRSESNLS